MCKFYDTKAPLDQTICGGDENPSSKKDPPTQRRSLVAKEGVTNLKICETLSDTYKDGPEDTLVLSSLSSVPLHSHETIGDSTSSIGSILWRVRHRARELTIVAALAAVEETDTLAAPPKARGRRLGRHDGTGAASRSDTTAYQSNEKSDSTRAASGRN